MKEVLVSVIVPTLNEGAHIGPCLDQFLTLPGRWELIVVDGGSADGTVAAAAARGARLVAGVGGGRGPQLNAGAAIATGDVLLFLHADARLPREAHRLVCETLARREVAAGAFRVRHVPERWRGWRAALLRIADLRSRWTRRPYGDQGLFLRRETFLAAGGYPERPLMEDLAFARRLARVGRITTLEGEIQVSGRRFEAGLLRATLCMNTFPLLDRLGVPPRTLARLYGDPR